MTALRKIAEGREAEIFAWEDGRVLRLFRDARSRESVEREMAAMRAARRLVPAVPEVFGAVERDGRPGIILERVEGPDLLTLLGKRPWTVWSAARTTAHLQAELHEVVAPDELRPLREALRAGLSESPLVPEDVRQRALTVLASLPDGDRLCHGDFHPGNIIATERGPVVIDWPNAFRADPLADVARTLTLLRLGSPPPSTSPVLLALIRGMRRLFLRAYQAEYRRRRPVDARQLARWEYVVGAARLIEDIAEEQEALLRWLAASELR